MEKPKMDTPLDLLSEIGKVSKACKATPGNFLLTLLALFGIGSIINKK